MIESNNTNRYNGLELLSKLPKESIACVFFDPQYRGILDKMAYGNENTGKQARRANLTQMSADTIKKFITEYNRVLKPSGHLFLWIDKYELCQGSVKEWLRGTSLRIVDMIVWNKMRLGLGYRSRRTSEYLVVLQKEPLKAKYVWKDRSIPDVWDEKLPTKAELIKEGVIQSNETLHPHRKPFELQRRLVLAVTNENDTVVDCAAGSYSLLDVCKATGRRCICCDIEFGTVWNEEMNLHKSN